MTTERDENGTGPKPSPEDHAAIPLAGDGHLERTTERPAGRMLEALVCPLTGTRLVYDAERGELISRSALLAFPIRSGIPIMLVDEARKLHD